MTQSTGPTVGELLSVRRLAPSAALYGAYIAISDVLGTNEIAGTEYDQQTIDLLLRLEVSPEHACRAVDLAAQLMVSTSHMSRVIDKVEGLGLVKRARDPSDRRANQVVATPKGCEVVAIVAPHIASTLDRVIHTKLNPGEIDTLIELLGRIEHECRLPAPSPEKTRRW